MNENAPSIEERVGKAISRGDLRQREYACDLDKICALGIVGIGERLAGAIFRLKYGLDPKGYGEALAGVYMLALGLNRKLRWNFRQPRLERMTRRVMVYWLADNCPLCTGLGYEIIHSTPYLSDRACPQCLGTRKRAMPWTRMLPREPEGRHVRKETRQRWRRFCERMARWQEAHRTLLVALEVNERVIGDKMIQKLSNEVCHL